MGNFVSSYFFASPSSYALMIMTAKHELIYKIPFRTRLRLAPIRMEGKLMFVLFSGSNILLTLALIIELKFHNYKMIIPFGGSIILITFIIWAFFIRPINNFEKVYSNGFLLNFRPLDLSFEKTQIFIPYNEVVRIKMNTNDIRFSLGSLGEVEVSEEFAEKYDVPMNFKIKRPVFFEFILPRIKEQVDEKTWKKWGAPEFESEA